MEPIGLQIGRVVKGITKWVWAGVILVSAGTLAAPIQEVDPSAGQGSKIVRWPDQPPADEKKGHTFLDQAEGDKGSGNLYGGQNEVTQSPARSSLVQAAGQDLQSNPGLADPAFPKHSAIPPGDISRGAKHTYEQEPDYLFETAAVSLIVVGILIGGFCWYRMNKGSVSAKRYHR